jgi:hypothetical protein
MPYYGLNKGRADSKRGSEGNKAFLDYG